MQKKHAYMIIAHNKFDILEKLVKLLDDERNDIYIHVDKKVEDFDFKRFSSILKYSNITFVPRISVNWGGYSQIKCELILLKEATKQKYEYYHLLSGVDLPLKTQDEIHDYFEKNNGTEFIHFVNHNIDRFTHRISRFHIFQDYKDISKSKFVKILIRLINKLLLEFQKVVKVNRLKNENFTMKYGAQWFSITDNLAKYVLEKEEWIKKVFSYSLCSDELFLQTLAYNSNFRGKISNKVSEDNYNNCLRKIDWKRGRPYIWRLDDYKELMSSDFLFARKFDSDVDEDIIKKIDYLLTKKQNS